MDSQMCQSYHQDCEDGVNKQMNMELYSSDVSLLISLERIPAIGKYRFVSNKYTHFGHEVGDSVMDIHLPGHKGRNRMSGATVWRRCRELCDFLPNHYLDEKVKKIKKLGGRITDPKRLLAPDNGLGEYLFDKFSPE